MPWPHVAWRDGNRPAVAGLVIARLAVARCSAGQPGVGRRPRPPKPPARRQRRVRPRLPSGRQHDGRARRRRLNSPCKLASAFVTHEPLAWRALGQPDTRVSRRLALMGTSTAPAALPAIPSVSQAGAAGSTLARSFSASPPALRYGPPGLSYAPIWPGVFLMARPVFLMTPPVLLMVPPAFHMPSGSSALLARWVPAFRALAIGPCLTTQEKLPIHMTV